MRQPQLRESCKAIPKWFTNSTLVTPTDESSAISDWRRPQEESKCPVNDLTAVPGR